MTIPVYPITVFYDGACRLCVKQMNAFRHKDREKKLIFIDISSATFNARDYGLENEPIQSYIYARDGAGHIVRGLDAFIWLWSTCNQNLLAFIAGLPLVKELGKFFYRLIASLRYRFFGKNESRCDFHCAKKI